MPKINQSKNTQNQKSERPARTLTKLSFASLVWTLISAAASFAETKNYTGTLQCQVSDRGACNLLVDEGSTSRSIQIENTQVAIAEFAAGKRRVSVEANILNPDRKPGMRELVYINAISAEGGSVSSGISIDRQTASISMEEKRNRRIENALLGANRTRD